MGVARRRVRRARRGRARPWARLAAGRVVGDFPPSPRKQYENKRKSGNAKRIDAVHCRRSRTNKDLTCTRIRALGQRRDKEIPKTPTTSSRATRRFEPWSGARRPVEKVHG